MNFFKYLSENCLLCIGSLDSNCFYFEPHDLQSLSVIDGTGRKFTVQVDDVPNSYEEFYRFLVQESNLNYLHESMPNITLDNYGSLLRKSISRCF